MSQLPEVPSVTSGSGTTTSGLVSPAVDGVRPKHPQDEMRDGGWGWVVVVGSCICHFFLIGINRSMGIVYLLLQEQFDATGKETALVASIFVSLRALGGPVASKLSDRFGCRSVTMIGGILLCVGLLLSAFAVNIINVYITMGVVAGLGGVLIFSPSYIAVSHWFDKKKGKAMAFSTLGTGFGSIVMGPVIMTLVSYYGYFGTMLITSALMLNNSVGGALYRPPPKNSALQGVVLVEKTVKDDQELNVFSEETAAGKTKSSVVNPIDKKVKDRAELVESEKSSEFDVSLEARTLGVGGVKEKSAESGLNFEEKSDEKLLEIDQNANDIKLEKMEKSKLEKSQISSEPNAPTKSSAIFSDKRTSEKSRDLAEVCNPDTTNVEIASLDSPNTVTVDTKTTLPNSQLSSNPELPIYRPKSIQKDTETTNNGDAVPPRRRHLGLCPCSPFRLLSFFKSSLWFNVPFILYCTMVTATQGCIQSVLIFLPGCGRELGATRQQASLLLTVFGCADMVGRFVFGFIFDLKSLRSRRTHLYTAVAASFGAMSLLLGFMPSYLSLAVVTALVAFFEGGAHSQRATNVTELVEPSQMSIGVGLVIFFQGLGNFYGPLVGGALKDRTGSFSTSFIFGGTTLLCACLLTVLFSVVRGQIDKRKKRKTEDTKVDAS